MDHRQRVTPSSQFSVKDSDDNNGDAVGNGALTDDTVHIDRKQEAEVTTDVKGLDLHRTVSLMGAISFTVGTMIGSGIFITPTSVLRNAESVGLTMVVWSLGGVISLLGSFTVAELACRLPKHGGLYSYLQESLGSWVAFLYVWNFLLIIAPSSLAVKSLTFSRYFVAMLNTCGMPSLPVHITAVTLIVTLCVINMTSSRLTVRINVVFLVTKVIALLIIVVGGLVVLIRGGHEDSELTSGFSETTQSPANIARSVYFVMWAYSGWAGANYIVEEVKNPSRNVPLASILGVLVVTVIYVMANVSYLAVMSRHSMLAADTVAVTWGNAVLGTGLASLIIPLCVMTSTAGSANSGMFLTPRVIFAAARDGNFPEIFSFLHVNSRIPLPAVSVLVSLGMVYASSSSIIELINVVTLSDWFFYFLSGVGLLVLRYRQPKDMHVPFKQPLVGVVLFTLLSVFLVVMPLTDGVDFTLLYTAIFMVVGVVVYVLFQSLKDRTQCCDGLVTFIQLWLRVGPPSAYNSSP